MAMRRAKGEGSLYYSESKRLWVGKVQVGSKPNGSPRYVEVTGRFKVDAAARMAKVRENRSSVEGMRTTVGEYLDRWLNGCRADVAELTHDSYERCVRLHIKPRIGGVRLGKLTVSAVKDFFTSMTEDGVSRGHAKKVGEVLSSALEHAVRTELITGNPARSVKKPKHQPPKPTCFPPADVKAVLRATEGTRTHAAFAVAVSTGMRQGELLALEWADIDLEGRAVSVSKSLSQGKGRPALKSPKSARGYRVVDLPEFCVTALLAHRDLMAAEGNHGAPVFCTSNGTHYLKSNFVRKVHHHALESAGVAPKKFHAFRHTHVSELLASGVSLAEVASRVGDHPETIARTYAHLVNRPGRSLADKTQSISG